MGERIYDIEAVGYKYHLNDLAAAVGLGNLEGSGRIWSGASRSAPSTASSLADVAGLELLRQEGDRTNAYWLFTVLVERREDFIRKLKERGVPASVVHLRIDHNSVFGGLRDDLPGQAEFNERQVAIPVHQGLSDEEVERVTGTIRAGW